MDRVDYQSFIIQDLVNDHDDDKLDLNPWYQRRSVWTPSQKSYLINTLFERKPIPAIYVRHTIDLEKQKSIKEVVDGQQRSRAVIEYCKNNYAARISQSGSRKKFSELNPSERERFLLTPLPVGYLLGASDEDVIDIFARINSVSKTLNPQEKRNAMFSGEFKQFCLRISSGYLAFWRGTTVFSANDIARMNEVQFVSEVILNMLNGLSDSRQSDITKIYKTYEDDFPQSNDILKRLERILGAFMQIDQKVFRNTIFNRQPILFSLMICLDQNPEKIEKKLEDRMYRIDAAFQDETNEDAAIVEFRRAVSASTQRYSSRKIRHDFLAANL